MMSAPRLVNNQFNSPIKLYSPENIQETLERQTQVLSNGAVGIDFNKLSKPANLQNSAVLRMLEEEEEQRKRLGKPGLRRVEWPPTKEGTLDYVDFVEQSPVQSKTRGQGEYATYQSKSAAPREEADGPGEPIAQPSSQASASRFEERAQRAKEHVVPVSRPWESEAPPVSLPWQTEAPPARGWSSVRPKEHIVPVSCAWRDEARPTADLPSLHTWRPQIRIKQTPPTPTSTNDSSGWSDKPGGGACNGYPRQPSSSVGQEAESPQSHYKPQSSAAHLEPPATLITLRAEPPISQEPSPVYQAQPAATEAAYDGTNMRGDQKWPPASVKEQTEAENRARIELAKGPAFRPRKVHKDYSGFFAQHAVTNNYPGYRAPPGTQFFTPAYQH